MSLYVALIVVSLKMFYRNRQAIFFTVFFPLVILLILGILNFDRFNEPDVGVVDLARNEASRSLVMGLGGDADDDRVLDISEGDHDRLLKTWRMETWTLSSLSRKGLAPKVASPPWKCSTTIGGTRSGM